MLLRSFKSVFYARYLHNNIALNGIKVQIFFGKNIEKKHLCRHYKNYDYFCKSNVPVINLIAGSRNMNEVSKNMSLLKVK